MQIKIIPETEEELEYSEACRVISSIVWNERDSQYAYMFDLNYTDWMAKMPAEEIATQLANLSATLVNTFAINIAKNSPEHNSEQIMAKVLEKTPEAFSIAPDPQRNKFGSESDPDK